MSTDLGRLNCMARSQHPFCELLRIHENEIARKNCRPIREHQFELVNSERDIPKMRGKASNKAPLGY